jgi:hypothetical protein
LAGGKRGSESAELLPIRFENKHREVGWQQIERLAGKVERFDGTKREGCWHSYGEVYWQL